MSSMTGVAPVSMAMFIVMAFAAVTEAGGFDGMAGEGIAQAEDSQGGGVGSTGRLVGNC